MLKLQRHLPRKVEFARDALVTLIHDRDLKKDDRLPSYSELRDRLKLGSQTIAAAIGSLCELGVLEVRDKVGIFVKDPNGGHLAGRTIAIAVRRLTGSAYSATLAGFIQKLLNERSCRCLTFYQNFDPDTDSASSPGEFPGLEQSLMENRCDGLITLAPLSPRLTARLNRLGVRCCLIGDDDQYSDTISLNVVISVRDFLVDAVAALHSKGCSRLIQLCVSPEQLTRRDCGIPSLVGCNYTGGAAIARKLLALAPELRPDGIVSDDDTVVSGLLAELIRVQLPTVNYLPYIATIFHKELNELYPSGRMILFGQNIEDYARLGVDLLLGNLRGEISAPRKLVYRFSAPDPAL